MINKKNAHHIYFKLTPKCFVKLLRIDSIHFHLVNFKTGQSPAKLIMIKLLRNNS